MRISQSTYYFLHDATDADMQTWVTAQCLFLGRPDEDKPGAGEDPHPHRVVKWDLTTDRDNPRDVWAFHFPPRLREATED